MSFIETPRFPENVSLQSRGGPLFKTTITSVKSGYESRNQDWKNARYEYDAGFGVRQKEDIEAVLNMFYLARGKLYAFRYKDWSDYTASFEPIVGTPDGFRLYKKYGTYYRKIVKPVSGSVTVYNDQGSPIAATVDYETGIVTGAAVDETCTWSGQFDVPVRFDQDDLQISWEAINLRGISSIRLVEVRGAG